MKNVNGVSIYLILLRCRYSIFKHSEVVTRIVLLCLLCGWNLYEELTNVYILYVARNINK